MVARPASLPRWATNPPGSTITAPTGLQQQEGWQPAGSGTFPDGKPVRQIQNWMDNLNGDWAAWLDQVTHRTSDLHPDHALPGGTPPALGAGFAILAGAFSGRAYAAGYEASGGLGSLTVPGPNANYTYTASRDTYWDLSPAGVWTPVVVANGAGEPAVTALSTRMYVVITDGTGRTTLIDRRRARVRLATADVVANLRFAIASTLDNGGGSTDAERRSAHRTDRLDALSGATYELVHEFEGNNSIDPVRVYARILGATIAMVVVIGARCTSTSGTVAWIAESAVAYRFVFNGSSSEFAEISGLTPDVTAFNDSIWTSQLAANATRLRRRNEFGIRTAIDPTTIGADANQVAHRESVRSDAYYTLIFQEVDQSGVVTGQYEYLTGRWLNTVGLVARVKSRNCHWDDNAHQWVRDAAGDAYVEVNGSGGFWLLRHTASGGGTWADSIAAGTWVVSMKAGLTLGETVDKIQGHLLELDQNAPIPLPAAPRLYADQIVRVWGLIATSGGGGITTQTGVGYTAAIQGTNVRITFAVPFLSNTDFAPSIQPVDVGYIPSIPGVTGSTLDVHLRTDAGTDIDLSATAHSFYFSIVGRTA